MTKTNCVTHAHYSLLKHNIDDCVMHNIHYTFCVEKNKSIFDSFMTLANLSNSNFFYCLVRYFKTALVLVVILYWVYRNKNDLKTNSLAILTLKIISVNYLCIYAKGVKMQFKKDQFSVHFGSPSLKSPTIFPFGAYLTYMKIKSDSSACHGLIR